MKKIIIAAISALAMLAPATMRAEEAAKEYNMVITLQNGTTITLGHNDIKNITFDGEEISISGNVVNTIDQLKEQNLSLLNDLNKAFSILNECATVSYVDKMQSYNDDTNAALKDQLYSLEKMIYDQQDKIEGLNKKDAELYDIFKNAVTKVEDHVYTNEARIKELEVLAAELRDLIEKIRTQLGL